MMIQGKTERGLPEPLQEVTRILEQMNYSKQGKCFVGIHTLIHTFFKKLDAKDIFSRLYIQLP